MTAELYIPHGLRLQSSPVSGSPGSNGDMRRRLPASLISCYRHKSEQSRCDERRRRCAQELSFDVCFSVSRSPVLLKNLPKLF